MAEVYMDRQGKVLITMDDTNSLIAVYNPKDGAVAYKTCHKCEVFPGKSHPARTIEITDDHLSDLRAALDESIKGERRIRKVFRLYHLVK